MHYPVLAKGTGYFKKETEGREKMMGVIEELINEAVKEVAEQKDQEMKQQRKETEAALALRMIDSGISMQQVSEITGLSVEELNSLAANRS
jgi:predicted transposase YdaD